MSGNYTKLGKIVKNLVSILLVLSLMIGLCACVTAPETPTTPSQGNGPKDPTTGSQPNNPSNPTDPEPTEPPEGAVYHCICGTADDNHLPGCDGSKHVWTEWTATDSLPATTGKYYLAADVNVAATIIIDTAQDVYLDLNGFKVTSETRIYQYAANDIDTSVTILDSVGTGTVTVTKYTEGGPFAVFGATGNKTMTIYGGTFDTSATTSIEGKAEGGGNGGFVRVGSETSTLNIHGGKIISGTANQGGAIHINKGTVVMTGGIIEGGTARNGGNMVVVGGSFTMTGGEMKNGEAIDANGRGGNIFNNGGTVKISGTAKVYDGICVTYGPNIFSTGTYTTEVAAGCAYLTDKEGMGVYPVPEDPADTPVVPEGPTGINGCTCGSNSATAADHLASCEGNVDKWVEWTSNSTLPKVSGYYKLTQDVTVTNISIITASEADIYLDLNGKTIYVNVNNEPDPKYNVAYRLENNAGKKTLTILDSSASKSGKFVMGEKAAAIYILATTADVDNTVVINGGTFVGSKNGVDSHGGVLRAYGMGCKYVMNAGTIQGATMASNRNGGSVSVEGFASFTMNGGKIYGGSAQNAGNILLNTDSYGYFYGGEIYGGTVTDRGGNIFVSTRSIAVIKGSVKIYGGVTSNTDATKAKSNNIWMVTANSLCSEYAKDGETVTKTPYYVDSNNVLDTSADHFGIAGNLGSGNGPYLTSKNPLASAEYKVNYWTQKPGETEFSIAETVTLSALVGRNTGATAKAIEHYTARAFQQKAVAADGSTVIDIYYDPVKYTVTWVVEGETVGTTDVAYGTAITLPETEPTKVGYSFDGWGEVPATMPGEALTLTAEFKINQYTITFDSQDGSAVESITADFGAAVTAPANPTKEGFAFTGWYLEGATEPYTFTTMPAEDITLIAQWTEADSALDVVFFNGTEQVDAQQVAAGGKLTVPSVTKEGYELVGWFTNEDLSGDAWDFVNGTVSEDMKLYAKWAIKSVTITFDTDGGSEVPPMTQDFGTAVEAPEAPTKEGYEFEGWLLNGEAYEFTTMPADDITLVAKWKSVIFTITFDSNGGSAVDAITQAYGSEITAPTAPTKDGATFVCWLLNGEEFTFDTMPMGDTTLVAKWDKYNVELVYEADTWLPEMVIAHGATLNVAEQAKVGFKFAGWFTDAEFTQAFDVATPITSDITLYGKFEEFAWTPWGVSEDQMTSLPNTSGYYQLVGDINMASTMLFGNDYAQDETIFLDLNGKNVIGPDAGGVIAIASKTNSIKLTILDTAGGATVTTKSQYSDGGGGFLALRYLGTHVVNIYGGTYTQAEDVSFTANAGWGHVTHSNVLNMYGGTVTGFTTTMAAGGLRVDGGVFYMYGGTFTNNTAGNGGNLAVQTGYAYLYGGTISNGKAYTSGGTNNRGGNIFIHQGRVYAYEDILIFDGTCQSAGKPSDNVYFVSGTGYFYNEGANVFFTDGKGDGINSLKVANTTCRCGYTGTEDKHLNGCDGTALEGWIAWGDDEAERDTLPSTTGNYYLVTDITVSKVIVLTEEADIVLDLNGRTVFAEKLAGSEAKFNVIYQLNNEAFDKTVTILDSSADQSGRIELGDDAGLAYLRAAQNTLVINGGTIVGSLKPTNVHGGIIRAYGDDADIIMNGGTIIGADKRNNSSAGGGALCIEQGASFTMNGGVITGGQGKTGGNIFFNTNGLGYLYGGEIYGGYASDRGGNLFVSTNAKVVIAGTKIYDGQADSTDAVKGKSDNIYFVTNNTLFSSRGETDVPYYVDNGDVYFTDNAEEYGIAGGSPVALYTTTTPVTAE